MLSALKQLKPTKFIIINSFCFYYFAQKLIPGAVLALRLLLAVFVLWTCPRWYGGPQNPHTNPNIHSQQLLFQQVYPKIDPWGRPISGLEVLKAQADFGDALLFPRVPCHSQGVERTVQLVTKACKKVKSHTRRHQEILSKLYWRKLKAQGRFVPRGQKSPRTPITPRSPRPKRSRK